MVAVGTPERSPGRPTRWAVGNWKMHLTAAAAADLAADLAARLAASPPRCRVAIAPPFTALAAVGTRLGVRSGTGALTLAGQDVHPAPAGAHTGAIAAAQLADLGCELVLVGHSEVRARSRGEEVDAQVRGGVAAALAAGLQPILCVGEARAARDAGEAEATVTAQLDRGLAALVNAADLARVAVAYEPIWAIGGGGRAADGDIVAMHAALRAHLDRRGRAGRAVPLLYGGSVRAAEAAALAALPAVDGLLVGGASLEAAGFAAIAAAVG